jgi:hypothetical protein
VALLYYESTEKSIQQKGKDGIYGVWAYFSAFILCLEYGENTLVIMIERLHPTFLKAVCMHGMRQ